jgi:starch synthase
MMQVLQVASEAFPLIKTGGLADVVGALPGALAGEGVAMRSLLPGYPAVMAALRDATLIVHDIADLPGGPARLLATRCQGLDVLVLDAPQIFDRAGGPYANAQGQEWPDNPLRFASLAAAAARIAQRGIGGWRPDLLHAHDWQAGLVPAYLHYWGIRTPSVMTIHNLAFPGKFDPNLAAALFLPPEAMGFEGMEFYGAGSMLKAGLVFADRVTTVSPSYAAEILTPDDGMGLDGVLRARGAAVSGILNGIDTTAWNPASDGHLAARFTASDRSGRAMNKAALQDMMGLAADPDAPLFGVVSRLSWQKGLDVLLAALPALLGAGAQLVVLGAGDPSLEAGLRYAAAAHPGRIGCRIGYDEGLARLIQGGVDALLVPSRFEPCGLTQLCALRYGAIPVVARVGGLADTVIDANAMARAAGVATGVQFAPVTPERLSGAIAATVALYHDHAAWHRMQDNAMAADVSWTQPARLYARLYAELVG